MQQTGESQGLAELVVSEWKRGFFNPFVEGYKEIPQNGWLRSSRKLLLTVLESGSLR